MFFEHVKCECLIVSFVYKINSLEEDLSCIYNGCVKALFKRECYKLASQSRQFSITLVTQTLNCGYHRSTFVNGNRPLCLCPIFSTHDPYVHMMLVALRSHIIRL